jgi:hypothetical protein
MAYFPNGTAGLDYEDRYCSRCIHNDADRGCPIILLHMLHNYDECNKPDSFLHVLIPRSKDQLDNERCLMFIPAPSMANGSLMLAGRVVT